MPNAQIMSVLRQQLSAVMQNAGEVVTWRAYVSASANSAYVGLGTAYTYSQRTITALMESVKPVEQFMAGGTYQMGDVWATTVLPIGLQDEIVWDGQRYQAVSEPNSIPLFGSAMNRTQLRRG